MGKKRILFIGHSYHKKTGSSKFIEQILAREYDMDCVYDESWITHGHEIQLTKLALDKYYAIVIWQIADLLSNDIVAELTRRNTIFFPMENYGENWDKWKRYKKFKIVSFSKYNFKKLSLWGFDVHYFQYFPRPLITEFDESKKKYTVFFWQRVNALAWPEVKKLINKKYIAKVILHKSIDPGHEFVSPSERDIREYNIEMTEWFNDKAELTKKLMEADIYIAPRLSEGIGFSFLEAMAMGKAVVAVNMPTMSEYISNKKNGYLFDIYNICPINLERINNIRKNCIQSVQKGFVEWKTKEHEIYEIVEREYSPDYRRIYRQGLKNVLIKLIRITKDILKGMTPLVLIRLRRRYL